MDIDAEPVLIVSPRYAEEMAALVSAAGLRPRVERRAEAAAARLAAEAVRIVVVDARGALGPGLTAARMLGPFIETRRGAMLVLLSRGDAKASEAAREAGATAVLVSPFGSDMFANALLLASRQAARLAAAATTPDGDAAAAVDRVTGLATGDRLQAWLADQLAAAQPAGVIILGVGRFGQINNAYGRDVADRLLAAVSRRLEPVVSAGAAAGEHRLLARLSAAEFALAVAGLAAAPGLETLARQLLAAIEAPFGLDDRLIHVSARAGVAWSGIAGSGKGQHEAPGQAVLALLREAGIALADARSREPGAVARFSGADDAKALARRAELESDLYAALANDRITLLFQPQASLGDGHVEVVEALARWDHPVYGRLSAATLLDTAASAELAVALGRHIRNRAIAAAARWTGPMAELSLSINVTAADLADPAFIETLAVDLARAGLSPRRLVIEVTEEAIIADHEAASATLSLLRRDGVRVALDDFGAGYSNLARLARLSVDTIKLDRSFAQGLTGNERGRILVEGIIGIARRLGLAVVAEGIEDDMQMLAARAAGCHSVQGYCVAPPLDEAALADFCRRRAKRSAGG